MKTLHFSIIAIFMFVFFFTLYMENSHDVHATCVTINGIEECAPPPPILNSIKSHYVPNETIQLVGAFSPNTMIQIDLVDPNDNIKNSVLVQSDSSGSFQSKMVVPNDAVNGTWKINTSSGLNHGTFYITVISKNLQDNQTNPNHSIPVTLTQSPLKQFRSGIDAKYVTCKEGFQLVLKAEDYTTPACVQPETATKLIQRGWALETTSPVPFIKKMAITGLQQTYAIGQPINATVKYTGYSWYQEPDVKILDANGTQIWFNCAYCYARTEAIQSPSFGTFTYHVREYSSNNPPVINKTGTYTMVASLENQTASAEFTIVNPLLLPAAFMPCDTPYNTKETYRSPVLPNGTLTVTDYTPIFYMPMNSTGKICVHYSNSNPPGNVGIRVFDANDLANDAKDITTSASQNTIPTGNTTVVYTINTGNKAGFYGISLFCGGQAFAVGYDNQSRIVVDDFPWYGKTFYCPAQTYDFKITGLSGIGIYYITETTRPQIGYNITGISVSSVHLTPSSQNVTFTLNVRTYNTGAKLWFDFKDSNAVKFIGDPLLKEYSNPCNWSFNNDRSVDNAQWLKLVGGFRVTDNPVTIPPYSNGTYTFSIFAKNLDYGWYGLSPIIFSEAPNSNIPLENLGGSAVASYYPITMGLDSNLDPSGVCDR